MRIVIVIAGVALLVLAGVFVPCFLEGGEVPGGSGYSLLSPIRSGNLTVFPVVAGKSYDTAQFLTLDEGLRSGEVVIAEAGQVQGMIRRRPGDHPIPIHDNAQVNRLVLVNNSSRPLLLLAGEIVSGGKKDRVIGKDRIVPAESDPVDLSVFCVEPGRWVATSGKYNFSAGGIGGNGLLAAPGVRSKVMAEKDQQQVWANVAKARTAMSENVMVEAGTPRVSEGTTSYARVMDNKDVQKQV
ncbi:MAG TPA: DUF6569 family protein, partial [Terriglobales bacterium]